MKKKLIIISFLLILLDQLAKKIIVSNLILQKSIILIKNFFSLTYIRNTGAAFGMFSNGNILLIIVSIVFLIFLIKLISNVKKMNNYVLIYLSMIISGVIGNLIDRLFRGYVVDYLDFQIFNYNFPVFNLADTFIVIGILLLIVDLVVWGDKYDL